MLVLLLLSIVYSCKPSDINITNLNDNKITVLGHGGMGFKSDLPMNSFESIYQCLNMGAAGTEIDIQMTKDSVLVAYHDEKLENSTDAKGIIYTKNWSEIKNATYNKKPFIKYKLVTLDQILSRIPHVNKYTFFLDIKSFNPDTSEAYLNTFYHALFKVIDKYNLDRNVVIELKRSDLINNIILKRPSTKIFTYAKFEDGIKTAKKYNLKGITVAVNEVSAKQITEAHENGIMVAIFNAHTNERNKEAISKNADFIQTDKLEHLLKLLN